MSSIRTFLSYTLLLAILSPSVSADSRAQQGNSKNSQVDFDAFQKLLNQADPPALHSALHDYSPKKFGHGMFPEDRTAVEAIHREEPDVATGILKVANLARRQVTNSSVQITTSAQESQEPNPTRVTPVPLGGESSTTTSEAPSTITSGSATPSETASITSAGATASSASSSSSSSSASLTAGQVITTTNSVGLTIISTVGGGAKTVSPSKSSSNTATRSSLTSTLVHTSTLPNGQQSTITAVTVIGAGGGSAQTPSGTAGAGSTGTGTGQPGLQTGEAVMTRGCGREMAMVLGAAVGVAFML